MKLVFSILIAFVVFSIQAQVNAPGQVKVDPEVAPVMTFEKTIFDWGTINEGEKQEFDFKFTNTGKTDLIITRIKGSCGCTVPSNWSKEPIKPGEKSSFHVVFNSRNKPNRQQKTITVSCNTATGRERVKIKGMVIPDPKMVKMRAERAEKRKEMYAKRKAERESKAKENGLSNNKKVLPTSPNSIKNKELRKQAIIKREKNSIERKRSKSIEIKERNARKSDKEIKRGEKERSERLKLAKKEHKLKEKELKANDKERKQKMDISKKEQKLKEKEIRYSEKEIKRKEKEAKRKLDAEKKAAKESAKKAKKAQKEAKKLEKAAKKTAKAQVKVNSALEKLDKAEAKLSKMQNKYNQLEMKGKLSPNDITKRKLEMEKQIVKINEAKAKVNKAKRKL